MTDTPAEEESVALDKPGDLTDGVGDDVGGEAGGDAPRPGSVADIRQWLPFVGLFVAFWASLPKYSGPVLNTAKSAEIADHVIPAILVAIVCLVALAARKRAGGPGAIPFFCGMAILLAGFWMVATHVPLISEAFRDLAPWAATVYHSSAAFAVFGFGLLWTVSHWSDLAAIEAATEAAKAKASAED